MAKEDTTSSIRPDRQQYKNIMSCQPHAADWVINVCIMEYVREHLSIRSWGLASWLDVSPTQVCIPRLASVLCVATELKVLKADAPNAWTRVWWAASLHEGTLYLVHDIALFSAHPNEQPTAMPLLAANVTPCSLMLESCTSTSDNIC